MTKKQLMKARRIQLGMKKYNQTRDKSIHLELTPHELRNLIMNSDPNNIHEDDFIPHDCYLCGESGALLGIRRVKKS